MTEDAFIEDPVRRNEVWQAWLAERPEHVREVAKHFVPWLDYRIKATGQRCRIYSFNETPDGRVTLKVITEGLFGMPGDLVFGYDPDDLELYE